MPLYATCSLHNTNALDFFSSFKFICYYNSKIKAGKTTRKLQVNVDHIMNMNILKQALTSQRYQSLHDS